MKLKQKKDVLCNLQIKSPLQSYLHKPTVKHLQEQTGKNETFSQMCDRTTILARL